MEDLDQDDEEDLIPEMDVDFGEFSYVAAVFNAYAKDITCTALILSANIVLTADYCVLNGSQIINPSFVSVLAGVVDMKDHDQDQWRYAVSIKTAKEFGPMLNTVALIKVNSPFFLNFSTNTVALIPSEGLNVCKALLWRFRDTLNRISLKSLVLNKYSLLKIEEMECKKRNEVGMTRAASVNHQIVCAELVSEGPNIECERIDGSCIVCPTNDGVGVGGFSVSFGDPTCRFKSNTLFIFYGVDNMYDWITSSVKEMLAS